MAWWAFKRGKNILKLCIYVEGYSDQILLNGQNNWFKSLGFDINIYQTGGRGTMIKKARGYNWMATLDGAKQIIFMPDLNTDACAMLTRENLGMDSEKNTVTIVMIRELEAWVLADGEAIQNSIGVEYRPAGQTDTEAYPKRKLHSLMANKLGYPPTATLACKIVAPHFSIQRAANYNTSAKRFTDYLKKISCN